MSKFMYTCTYSPGSWARLMRMSDDRLKAGGALVEALGGSVDDAFWEVSARAVYVITEMPDSTAAAAAAAVLTGTGAFKNVEAHEVLSQEQFGNMLELADDTSQVYEAPGQRLLQDDSSQSRF